ncbi:conserved hypothetical protein [Vibrio jasicida]|uniref:RiboL-PSP-HEPN domain-containing protein n=1 Tax=Vibrio jasicida TaxID=766224 RepID=A0AAU9QHV2_9VIBR|nr:conserved hypothetical protein [Vibrio jasicida]CAH1572404.1 conserved hypothetical protein [Vibrio jasicida]
MKQEDEFLDALYKEDDVGCVIYTHIHVENLIISYVTTLLKQPEHLKSMRLDYLQKVHLALSLGLPDYFKAPLLNLGKIRNNFAHRLDQGIDSNLVNNFFKSFSNFHKNEIVSQSTRTVFSSSSNWGSLPMKEQFISCCNLLHTKLSCVIIEHDTEKSIDEMARTILELEINTQKYL